jgi:holin-like protein
VGEVEAIARYVASAWDRVLPAGDAGHSWRAAVAKARLFSLGALQIVGLWSLNIAGNWVAKRTALPIPGNLIGMVLLYALLTLGVVKLSWLEVSGSFLIRHLAFFFVPITVGLMNTGPLFATWGAEIMVTLAASAAIGIALAGWISQFLLRRSWRVGDAA